MRDPEARGPIYREVTTEATYHDYYDEDVVVVRATFETYGLTQHQPIPLSIAAAIKLYQQLGEVLTSDVFSQYPAYMWEMSNEVAKTAEKLARVKEMYG
ncbi:hypothetical protein ACTMTF_15350 [Nonomuraea sp. ZG12]|uniref:hypothetical protein n=1 Tax=Nonomuraea sp. ZG12 TaxID=3452207 RepID=UPI003F8A7C71